MNLCDAANQLDHAVVDLGAETLSAPDERFPLIYALHKVREARRELAIVEADLEKAIAPMLDEKIVVEGGLVVESKRRKDRTQWDREALVRDVLDSRLVDTATGEVVDESPLDKVLAVWNLGAPRLMVLRDRGLDPDEYCHTEDRGWSVVVSGAPDDRD